MASTTPDHQHTALRCLELICAGDTPAAVADVIHPRFVSHRFPGPLSVGHDGFRHDARMIRHAFGDLSITPQDIIASADKVAVRSRVRGLHVGEFRAIAPTNHTIEFDQIHIWRFEHGLITDSWTCMDDLTALRQMGLALHNMS
jgi:predicted ester cyclase